MAVLGNGIRKWSSTPSSAASRWIDDRLDSERLQEYGPEILTSRRIAANVGGASKQLFVLKSQASGDET